MKTSLTIGALLFLQGAVLAQPAHRQSLPGHIPAAAVHLTPLGRLEATRELKLAFGLPLRNKEGLTNLLQRLYDPASPDFHHFLTPAQFAESFGATEQDYQAVTEFAQANNLKVTATHSNRTLLDVSGAVSNIEKALHITLRIYPHPRENRVFYAPDVEPALDLAAPVLHISGLDNYLLPRPMNLRRKPAGSATGAVPASGSGPDGTYMGNDFRAAYVPGLALTGAGQSVGLLEFDGYYPSDITDYAGVAAVPAVPLKNVLLDGFNGAPGANNLEVALDIDMAVSMAPGLSSIVVYEGETTDDILNRIATDDLANQLSASWTYSIDAESEQIFQQFAAQGQSFFNAAGDGDAYVGTVASPSDDPNLTSVGGTTLTTSGAGGAWVSETVWNWDVEFGTNYNGEGTGGGISATYLIPSWQTNISMAANQGSTVYRNVPDVALTADNVFVMADGGQYKIVGGTSCATPLWAGFTALANQQAAANGCPLLGFINPAIYALGQIANYASCFHDIATGSNTWSKSPALFEAVAGYDLCSGWGTPAGSNLINLLAPLDALQISLLGGLAASGAAGGPLTPASISYTLTNVGNASLIWVAGTSVPWLNISLEGGRLGPAGAAATVVVSFNAAASNLFLGTYGGIVWFTNLTDGAVQRRAFSLSVIKPPVITAQPASLAVIEGSTASFMADAAGGLPLNLQWQLNGSNLTDRARISGTQSNATEAGNIYGSIASLLTISNVAATDAGTYTLVASNAAGLVISSNAALTITPFAPVILEQPASQTVLAGATVQLTVVADGSAPLTYQWKQNGVNLTDGGAVAGSVTPTLTIHGASSASIGTYTVVVSNAINIATSTRAVLTVLVALQGGQLAQNGGFETGSFSSWGEAGNFVDCSVSSSSPAVYAGKYGALLGSSGSLGYLSQSLPTVAGQLYLLSLWLDSPDGLSPNEFLAGWNGSVLFDQTNLPALGWTNLQFYVMATGTNTPLEFGFRDDESFLGLDSIQVTPLVSADGPPILVTQPSNQVALAGGFVSLSVVAAGQLPLFYQWQFDNTNLPNATNATLTLNNLTSSQAGSYHVLVSNSLDGTTSSNALLTVLTGSPAFITFDDLPGSGTNVPAGYHSLTWSNFDYLDALAYGQPSGYIAGIISASNVAYNASGTAAAISGSGPFDLLSAYLTAAWQDNLKVEAQGYIGPTLSYDHTYTLSATTPTLINFDFVGVTAVQFISSGGSPHPGYNGSGTEFVLDNMTVVTTPPTPMSVLYSFSGFDGGGAAAGLAQGADGNFYGTTIYGGAYDNGTVFKMTTNSTLTTLLSFDNSNGSFPHGALIQGADGNFYGATYSGGTHDYGTVFQMTTNGTLTTLVSFDYSDGANPQAGLVLGADGNFYGTTADGGANGYGSVFSVTTNGTLTPLFSFDYSDGDSPVAGLVLGADGNFYGATADGGANSQGTMFRMTTNGTLTTLVNFNYSDGSNPEAALAQGADGNFYGTTSSGGTFGYGTIFKMTTNGTLTTLVSFDNTNGSNPEAGLLLGADGNFYGATSSGGTFFNGTASVLGNGTLFMLSTNGTLTTLLAFEGANGSSPQGGLVQGADGNFYGTTAYGGAGFNGAGASGNGVVFRLGAVPATMTPAIVAQPAGQIEPVNGTAIFSVTAAGAAPFNYSWQINGSPIAGATQSSYTNNDVQLSNSGSQFSCLISNVYGAVTSSIAALTVFSDSGPLLSFHGPDGGYAYASLIQSANGTLYGATEYGGTYGDGTVFSLTTNGLFSTLVSFDASLNGAVPRAPLAQGADGNFYGTTSSGGMDGDGTVFSLTTNGLLSTLVSFNGSGNGAVPDGALVQGTDGNFYGTTSSGGTNGYGTIFKMTTNGTLTTLVSFNYSDGSNPCAGLVQGADGNFYGTTESGGTNGYGTVFKMTTNGGLTTLVSFNYSDGSNPYAVLAQGADGNFYGATSAGGTNGDGEIFSITPGGTLTALFSFAGSNGLNPQAGLMQGRDGSFYGTTTYGGLGFNGGSASGNGTVFRLKGAFTSLTPLIVTQPASQSVPLGGSATFSVTALGAAPLNFFWRCNGAPVAGATSSSFTTNNVQLADSGSLFSCLVSNIYGTALSSNAILTVTASSVVQNGGFELGSFADWATNSTFQYCDVTDVAPYVHSGQYGAQLGPSGTLGYLSQTLPTMVGQSYQISCWLYGNGQAPNEFSVSWNGATLFDQKNIGDTLWTNLQFQASATTTNTVLKFGARDDPSYLGLDDISVVPIFIPPPQFQSVQLTNGIISFSWSAQSGQSYQAQTTTNLAQTNWANLGAVLSTTNTTITAADTNAAATERFYRIVLLP